MTCSSISIADGKEQGVCASIVIPSQTSISTSMKCNGYKVSVAADLHSRPSTLLLSASGNDGIVTSTASGSDLRLADVHGNGVFVRCDRR